MLCELSRSISVDACLQEKDKTQQWQKVDLCPVNNENNYKIYTGNLRLDSAIRINLADTGFCRNRCELVEPIPAATRQEARSTLDWLWVHYTGQKKETDEIHNHAHSRSPPQNHQLF